MISYEPMKPQILFVDDEAPIRELLSVYFRMKGYEVTTAASGSDAMRLADTQQFHLAIVDLNLAGENGLELLGFLKTNFPALLVIIFTGQDFDEQLVQEARARGADGFMSKTESLHQLFGEVERTLGKAA